MAAEKESRDPALRSGDDTRQDPSCEALSEAHLADPGGKRGDDTRQDRAPKAEPAYLCGLGIEKGVIQDKIDF